MQLAKQEIEKNSIFYVNVEIKGAGFSISPEDIQWIKPPIAEKVENKKERLRQFLDDHGSHYVNRVYYGQKLIIRSSYRSHEKSEANAFEAAVKAVSLFWEAEGKIKAEQKKILKSSKTDISTVVIGGNIPAEASYADGFEATINLMRKLKSGDVTIESGPIECELTSYWHTLSNYPNCRELFGQYEQPEPAEAPYGVPKGTIIAWYPREENIERDFNNGKILRVIAPQGWALCNGDGETQNLESRFLKGVTDFLDVGRLDGKKEHHHDFSVSGTTGRPNHLSHAKDKPDQEEFGSKIHEHSVSISGTTMNALNDPEFMTVLFIMKI
jgi:ribosome-associated translation inhibitor RaiA